MMSATFSFAVWTWIVLVALVLLLALYRLVITWGNYTVLHVRRSELSLVPEQLLHERRLRQMDFLGQALTAAVLVLGLALAITWLLAAVGEMGA